MNITEYIEGAPRERIKILNDFHEAILNCDPSVIALVKPMMGKETIIYEERCYMKYGLVNTKAYLSLHCLPMYMNPALHTEFSELLPNAKFQKGCINFIDKTELPLSVLETIIAKCSSINIAEVLEKRKKK